MNLEQWMAKRKLTDADLADRMGGTLSRSQISRIRRRVSRPSVKTAKALEAVTRIPAAKLVMVERGEA